MKLLTVIVTLFLLMTFSEVGCSRRTYSTSSGRGRGNRGKNQPTSGFMSSWFGGSKSSGSSSGSTSASKPVSTSAIKNWQTATSHTSSQKSSSWANPHYKPTGSAGSVVPSAPKQPANYGWKPADTKPASAYPSSNIGSRGYPVQSGVPQGSNSFAGYKPAGGVPSAPVLHPQPSSNLGGFKPAGSVSGTHGTSYQPSSNIGGYRPASGVPNTPNTHFQPSPVHNTQSGFGGYHPAPSHGYQPSHGASHVNPSYGSHPSGYHPSGYPTQSGGFSGGYHPPQSGFGHSPNYGSSVPSYQGSSLFGGSSGHYSYPSGGNWGVNTYGAKKSSGTGKLLTGLAVGAAGGYLTSSLVNRISNPWKYSGYGYGSSYGYGSGIGSNYDLVRARDESAFERGYERGAKDRNENNKEPQTPPAPPPTPEDPTSKWVNCVAFDPQTQQTLINPNCSCTVTTSLDDRTGQPISVHHCTTLNGLVMRPIPIQGPNPPVMAPEQPPAGINSPGAVPSYMGAYQENQQYGAMPSAYLPIQTETKPDQNTTEIKTEQAIIQTAQTVTEAKMDQGMAGNKTEETATGTVVKPEIAVVQNFTNSESGMGGQTGTPSTPQSSSQLLGGSTNTDDKEKSVNEFYSQLQKIVNMGNFVDGG